MRLRRYLATFSVMLVGMLVFAAAAMAQGPVIPDLSASVASYGDTILSNLGTAATDVLPYAAAFTVVGIVFSFVRRWIGKRKATNVA